MARFKKMISLENLNLGTWRIDDHRLANEISLVVRLIS